jgi:BMFP domain-containing protein YqiC
MDVTALREEVTLLHEVVASMEAARAATVLPVEASVQEATTAQDGPTLCIMDVEDRAAMVKMEAVERVSQALASTRDTTEGLAQKIALLESELVEECRAHETSER